MAKDAVTIVSAQIPSATRVALEQSAEANYRSLSSEIRLALDKHLQAGSHAMATEGAGPSRGARPTAAALKERP